MARKPTAVGAAGAFVVVLTAQVAYGAGNPLNPLHYAGQPASVVEAEPGSGAAYALWDAKNPLHPRFYNGASGFEGAAQGGSYVDKNNPLHASYNVHR